jgi:8-oxo-dGTP diphosphatase
MCQPPRTVREQAAAITAADDVERKHQRGALAWLDSSRDVYRRAKPATPPKHPVSYAVLVDPQDKSVFLVGHVLAGLCLPPGGHVEPGEGAPQPWVVLDLAGEQTDEEVGRSTGRHGSQLELR